MANMQLRSDYLHHEHIYAANPAASGWNLPSVDREILAYVEELLHEARVLPPARILELGCGMGNLAIPLACSGFEVVGIDISMTAIAAANKRAVAAGSSARFKVGDITSAQAYSSSEKFNCVVDGLCWHCIVGEDRRMMLDLVRHVLEPNGSFLVITMCGDPCGSKLRDRFDPRSRCITDGDVAQRYLGQPEELSLELSEAGFQVIYHRIVDGNPISEDQDMLLAVAIENSRSNDDDDV